MDRNELQKISKLRVKEARSLLVAGHSSGAYYLLGYSVECALKACISKNIKRFEFPDKKLAEKAFQHDLQVLFQAAGLWNKFKQDIDANSILNNNWAVVKDWKVESRYETSISMPKAKDFYSACTARRYGVLSWLRNYW